MIKRPPLNHPSHLTPELFSELLTELQMACEAFNKSSSPRRDLKIRDFCYIIEDGQTCLDIFVEPSVGSVLGTPFAPPEQSLSLDECLPLHQFLLEGGALDAFDDETCVRVGSLGLEPPLRTLEHFESARGFFVTLKTWTKRQGRDRFTMVLDEVRMNDSDPTLLLRDGTTECEVPLSAVKFAQALLEKPKAAKANAPRKSKRG